MAVVAELGSLERWPHVSVTGRPQRQWQEPCRTSAGTQSRSSFFSCRTTLDVYYAKCKEAAREPSIPEGISFVHPHVIEALRINKNVCVETTGASPEILNDLLSLTQSSNTLVVRVAAPLQLCLERIGSRDQTNQIPMDTETIRKVHALSDAAEIQPSFVLDNTLPLSDVEIIAMFKTRSNSAMGERPIASLLGFRRASRAGVRSL